jgi:hypothetical protein
MIALGRFALETKTIFTNKSTIGCRMPKSNERILSGKTGIYKIDV